MNNVDELLRMIPTNSHRPPHVGGLVQLHVCKKNAYTEMYYTEMKMEKNQSNQNRNQTEDLKVGLGVIPSQECIISHQNVYRI